MSLDAAEIDLSRAFTPGMGYVALEPPARAGWTVFTGMEPAGAAAASGYVWV